MEERELTGHWWTPGISPERAVGGTFRFASDDGLRLELLDRLPVVRASEALDLKHRRADVVLGVTHDGREVTLVGCWPLSTNRRTGEWIIESETWHADSAFIGAHFQDRGRARFDAAFVTFDVLDSLAGPSNFELRWSAAHSAPRRSVTWKRPEPLVAEWEGTTIVLEHVPGIEEARHEVRLSNTPRICVQLPEPWSVDELQSRVLYPLQNLSTLLADHPARVTGIHLHAPDVIEKRGGAGRRRPIELLYPPLGPRESEGLWIAPLFTVGDEDFRFEEMIPRWLDLGVGELRSVLNQYFGIQYAVPGFVELRFLTLVHSLEEYHRRRHSSTEHTNRALKEKGDRILRALAGAELSRRDVKWLQDAIDRFTEPALRQRIQELIEGTTPALTELIGRPPSFANLVADTRNYLSHGVPKLEARAASGDELFWLEKTARMLLAAILLKEIGLQLASIDSALARNRTYRWLLGQTRKQVWA